jgi:membrane protein implicated in regulation of membrane protease activity
VPDAFNPWFWGVAAVIIALLEIVAPGYYLIWIACAAALTAIAAFAVTLSLSGQLTVFIVASLVCCIAGFFVYRRLMAAAADAPALNQRELELLGAAGTAAEAFTNGRGKARIGDTVWLAEAVDDIPLGAPIVVEAVRGTTLVVGRRGEKSSANSA